MGPDWLRTFEGVEPMGRGRAKAKQVKVARQLKYKSDDTDLDRLRAEFGVGADSGNGKYDSPAGDYDDEEDDEDPGYAEDAARLRRPVRWGAVRAAKNRPPGLRVRACCGHPRRPGSGTPR
jgi:hypothetical protein